EEPGNGAGRPHRDRQRDRRPRGGAEGDAAARLEVAGAQVQRSVGPGAVEQRGEVVEDVAQGEETRREGPPQEVGRTDLRGDPECPSHGAGRADAATGEVDRARERGGEPAARGTVAGWRQAREVR